VHSFRGRIGLAVTGRAATECLAGQTRNRLTGAPVAAAAYKELAMVSRARGRLPFLIAAILLVAAVVSAAVYAAVVFAPRVHLPGLRKHTHLATTTAKYGSKFTLSGTTPHREEGGVVVEGSWNGGPWSRLGVASTVDGTFSVTFPIRRHGTLELRTTYPGGIADGTVNVP
jgi:hypothetical protein